MKRYLLVLDDVWNQDKEKWSCFRSALLEIKAASGSRILTTTRDVKVASTMEASCSYMLQRLTDEESWTIFKQRAFAQGGPVETADLVVIGKEIVKKCQGLPLAIKVIGSLMYSKEFEDEWLSVQNSQLWNLDDDTNRVLESLKLSYDHLSFPLKRCFSFFSFYPKDKEIEKKELIQRWMALGLLQPPLGSGLTMEDVGDRYFKTLVSCSFLEDARKDEMKGTTLCKLHDIVHDLALKTVQMDYSILNSQALVTSQINSKLYLRVLVLVNDLIENLPNSIKKLKHLRYLDISKTRISVLPKSITKLYNLQTLKTRYLDKVPKDFANLISLRHLCVKQISSDCMLRGIGRMTCLQTLNFFSVNREKGCNIEKLVALNDLSGDLTIYGLEHVGSTAEAKQALLSEKSRLRTLKLQWHEQREIGDGSIYNDENVMNGLEPHSKLEVLVIENFMGMNFAQWMMVERHSCLVLGNLVELQLINCEKCEKIPPIGHLQHLKIVEVSGMSNVESIGQEFYGKHTAEGVDQVGSSSGGFPDVMIFPSLVELTLKKFSKLERWEEVVQQQSLGSMNIFPCLKKLHIKDCGSLKILPSHFPSVTDLKIGGIRDNMLLKEMSRTFTTLTSLEIEDCNGSEFQSIMEELLGNNNRSLKLLRIKKCDELMYLPKNLMTLEKLELYMCAGVKYIHALPFAREVEIRYCRKLIGWPSLTRAFPVLEKLKITGCASIVEFPDMQSHMCLRELSVSSMYRLKSIPYLCNSLQRLEITLSPQLASLPEELGKALRFVIITGCSDSLSLPDFRHVQALGLRVVPPSKGVDCYPWASSSCLKDLILWGFKCEIKSLPEQLQQFIALARLTLYGFDVLESLPEWLGKLCSLKFLNLSGCEKLKYLPSLEAMRRLTKLDELVIEYCPRLEARCMKGTRPEWEKISNIANIQIGYREIKGSRIRRHRMTEVLV